MAINISVKLVPFGEIVYRTSIPDTKVEEQPRDLIEEPTQYHEPAGTAPRVLDIPYEREPGDYVAPSSTG